MRSASGSCAKQRGLCAERRLDKRSPRFFSVGSGMCSKRPSEYRRGRTTSHPGLPANGDRRLAPERDCSREQLGISFANRFHIDQRKHLVNMRLRGFNKFRHLADAGPILPCDGVCLKNIDQLLPRSLLKTEPSGAMAFRPFHSIGL